MSDVELEDFDFGFTSTSAQEIKSPNELDKANKIYKMILPLLNNLMKDSDKNEYIHWPNREEKIKAFIKKMEAVLKE